MDIKTLQSKWDNLAKIDPLWAILADAEKKGNKWKVKEFFDTGVKEINSLMEYVDSLGITIPKENTRALDFGCGVGRLTQAIANYFDQVYGVDIAPSMIELAETYNHQGNKCKYFLNNSSNLNQFKDNSFDFIYSNITLQHVSPRYSKIYLKEFLRLLSKNGVLIFQLPSEPNYHLLTRDSKGLIYAFIQKLPTFVIDLYFTGRYYLDQQRQNKKAAMDMYGIKQEKVMELLEANGAKVLDIQENSSAGKEWISFQYCVTKTGK